MRLPAVLYGYILCSVSIHASVKDATNAYKIDFESNGVSIHASVKDATQAAEMPTSNITRFQSTHL